ncbi:tetratricopeptide repeat protein [Ornithinibacillus halotolerans]|nr:tetratricopeptide repeat protein [Ornithinibacillus halotolerans]
MSEFADNRNPSIHLIVILAHLRMSILHNDNRKAERYYKKAEKLIDYLDEEMTTEYQRICGLYHYLLGDLEEALTYLKQVEKATDYPLMEEIYYLLSLIYSRQNELYLSTYYAEKALETFVAKMDYKQCTNCNLILGVNYYKLEKYDKALEIYHNILEQEKDNYSLKAKVFHNIGLLYSKRGQSELAIKYYQESIVLKDKKATKPKTIYLIAKEYYRLNEKKLAETWAMKGLFLAKEFRDKEYEIKLQVLILLITNQDIDLYIKNVAMPFFKQRGDSDSVREFIKLLTNNYEENKKFKEAYFLLKEYINI